MLAKLPIYNAASVGTMRLVVVCPMANEHETAERFVAEVLATASVFKEVLFLAVFDNSCSDGTVSLLRGYAAREPRLRVIWAPENRCVVDAYVRGYREALATGFEWVLEIDAGYSHQPSEIVRFLPAIESGQWDCIFGSRFCANGRFEDTSPKRKMLSWIGTRLSNTLLGTSLKDMTSGFQMFRREALSYVVARGIQSRAHFFQTEMKVRCRNLRICEVPITYRSASPSVNSAAISDALARVGGLFVERLRGSL